MRHVAFAGSEPYLARAYTPALRARLAQNATLLGNLSSLEASAADQVEALFSTWGMPVMDEEFFNRLPRLRAVFYAAGSVKRFATARAFLRGVVICGAWAANAIPVCEYTVSVIRLSLKRFWAYERRTRARRTFAHDLPVAGGYGARVGLVSLGAIGRRVLEALRGGDLEILAYDPFLPQPQIRHEGAQPASLEEIFRLCDVISLHTPWLPETEKLINEPLLRQMKEGATLVNTARGALVDEEALCRVLAERPDLTAVLDVTYPEPPAPESPLYSLENAVVTPHIAGSMDGEIERMGLWMVEEFERWLAGKTLCHQIFPEHLPRMA